MRDATIHLHQRDNLSEEATRIAAACAGSAVQALGSKVFLHPLPPPATTSCGLVIPDVARERCRHGIVVSVGPGLMGKTGARLRPQVEVGQHVIFTPYAEADLKTFDVGGHDVVIVDFREILAVVEP